MCYELALLLRCPRPAPQVPLCTHSTHAWKTRVGEPMLHASCTCQVKQVQVSPLRPPSSSQVRVPPKLSEAAPFEALGCSERPPALRKKTGHPLREENTLPPRGRTTPWNRCFFPLQSWAVILDFLVSSVVFPSLQCKCKGGLFTTCTRITLLRAAECVQAPLYRD